MPFNINDQVQQKAFKSETARLWNISQSFDSFEFHTIEDVLQELEECQNTVDKDIAELKKEVKQLGMKALEDIGGDNVIPRRILHIIVDLTRSKMQDNRVKHIPVKPKKEILAFVVGYKNQGGTLRKSL